MTRRPSCIRPSKWTATHADCFDVLQTVDANTVDAIITDPPTASISRDGVGPPGAARPGSGRREKRRRRSPAARARIKHWARTGMR
jgi:DNA modification methylase